MPIWWYLDGAAVDPATKSFAIIKSDVLGLGGSERPTDRPTATGLYPTASIISGICCSIGRFGASLALKHAMADRPTEKMVAAARHHCIDVGRTHTRRGGRIQEDIPECRTIRSLSTLGDLLARSISLSVPDFPIRFRGNRFNSPWTERTSLQRKVKRFLGYSKFPFPDWSTGM